MSKTKYFIFSILTLVIIGIIVGLVLTKPGGELPSPSGPSALITEPIDLSNIAAGEIALAKHYSLDPLNIDLAVSAYDLPVRTDRISNFSDFARKIHLSDAAMSRIEEDGFVVIKNPFDPKEEYITEPYKTLKDREIPVFITSDSLLHLYHIQFDETLRQIEEREFYEKIWEISQELLNESIVKYNNATGDLKEALRRNIAYLSVGLELLRPREDQLCNLGEYECQDPGIASAFFTNEDLAKYTFQLPDFVKKDVDQELELINAHQGFVPSPIFIYQEDYSQYVPRGHYTRSEKLKNYFKAFMWYGRISFLLKKDLIDSDDPEREARIQTMGASLLASEFAQNEELRKNWDRIYSVTAFYVGLSDDLGPYEYLEALNFVFSEEFDPNNLTKENIEKLKAKLAEYHSPKIFGGTGNPVLLPPFTPEQADKVLEDTKGFRLMGQRFIPDSYMFSRLVSPYVGMYIGKDCSNTFTCAMTDGGPARVFPRGLDIMALLGSERASELLNQLGDTDYEGADAQGNKISYETAFNALKEEFDGFQEEEWQKNLYWSWLYALKPLLKDFGPGYPTFMQTDAWQDKELTTALSSWAELRHDTILYAKQSYTMTLSAISVPPPVKPVVGYIEPVPEFYNRLLALARMTTKGLDEMQVLDNASRLRLENLEQILERLVELSKKELENKELEKNDYAFIKNFGDQLNGVIADVDKKAKKTTIIADVHTDGNTKQVLEEGVGYVDFIIVAYKVPDGRILIGAGPVMSYYEFKQPMSDRLTDEKWRDILETNPPTPPEWVSNFGQ